MKSNFEIKINKEIRDYTESILLGLSLCQTIFSIPACAIMCGLYFLFKERFGTEVTSWLCMLGAAPFAALGFIKFQGMYTEDIVKMVISSFALSTRNLINAPFNLYYETLEPFINQSRKESIVHDKKLRKIEKAQQRKTRVPRTVQDTIPVDTIYKDGIFRSGNKYTKSYRFLDINYKIVSGEDKNNLFLSYSDLLNSFDSSVMTKITIS